MLAALGYVSRIQLSNNQTLQESVVVVLPGWKRLVCGFRRMKEQEGPELDDQEGALRYTSRLAGPESATSSSRTTRPGSLSELVALACA